jgi:hypothetical protein
MFEDVDVVAGVDIDRFVIDVLIKLFVLKLLLFVFMFEQLFALLLFVVFVKLDMVSSEMLLLLVCLELTDIVGVRKLGD